MIFKKILLYNFIKYFIINVILKFIPILLLLVKSKYQLIFKIEDLYASIILICIYMFIMIISNKNPYCYYKMMLDTYIYNNNKYKTIFSKIYDYIYMKIIKN